MNHPARRSFLVLTATAIMAAGANCAAPRGAPVAVTPRAAASLSDREFWDLFTRASEPGGSFLSENFVSNELTFLNPIRPLQRVVRAGDAYLGVGPEQNFTYIANLDPGVAIIFDIRRQNAMAQLMYKALFELSPTRAEFVGRLFSRAPAPSPAGTPAPDAGAAELFDSVTAAPASGAPLDGVPAGGREKSRARNAARVGDSSNSALYISCAIAFWRRMSKMIAMPGSRLAM